MNYSAEVSAGQRFEFGKNWTRFLASLDSERVDEAVKSLKSMLEIEDLRGRRFLDIGSGSGLFSLAARRLGAEVCSFDYDPASVACTAELKRRYFDSDGGWRVEEGSALDPEYLATLGKFDVVYSWGVLHHTGAMWQALQNVVPLVERRGKLFISIYNDQGGKSRRWTAVKRIYNRLPAPLRWLMVGGIGSYSVTRSTLGNLVRGQNPVRWIADRKRSRGMSYFVDLIDWVGGYPFEVARPEEIFDFFRAHEFALERLKTANGGHGCNEFVFVRRDEPGLSG
ncbi:MAG: class I SAM-dependent methyltransferase [Deltaproteobacteria bacterium]|nr:class I SAM-dependent methyltransferase [Deltaproteobacteria bacterium]